MTQPRTPMFGLEPLDLLLAAGRGQPDARALLRSLTGGREVTAGHLREKPTLSVIARLTEHSGEGLWWAAGLSAAQRVKGAKARKRATALGVELAEHAFADGSILLVGPAATDPRLADADRELAATADIAPLPSSTLNYNPWRRAVRIHEAHDTATVVKLARSPLTASAAAANAVASSGGPALATRVSASGRLLLTPLASPDSAQPVDTQTAGGLLARIHTQAPLAESPSLAWRAHLSASVEQLSRLVPEHGNAVRALSRSLEGRLAQSPQHPVFLHGDFSRDQVLGDGGRGVVVDFDRHSVGAPGSDLGSYLAVELLSRIDAEPDGLHRPSDRLTAIRDELLSGYLEGGSGARTRHSEPTLDEIEAWTALHLLARASEPFRACAPNWRDDIAQRLTMIADLTLAGTEERA
ncbi:hypothetical protein C5E10_04010 [Pseudoclavibacter sp. RFBG4]|uniref:phosphotransferase family protein n=1 Tax=Pseudoclavibacter sp. RFBG4 TaxID=2080575 RepID=UPI000CE7B6E8|nr:phosphotransferase [Pseudoclavibacter sp. RFBG4]PPG35444.1 hypothetical protein C5E10_04010 [Pseudoclavibacter sp. RFBG4]